MLYTDHKPLIVIFNQKKDIPPSLAARSQRWSVTLFAYDYTRAFYFTQLHGKVDRLLKSLLLVN